MTARRVVVHVTRLSDASCHPFIRDRSLYDVERIDLMIVYGNLFLTGAEQADKEEQKWKITHRVRI